MTEKDNNQIIVVGRKNARSLLPSGTPRLLHYIHFFVTVISKEAATHQILPPPAFASFAFLLQMWDESTFDPETIEEELKWAAEKLGYNTLRTNLPMCLFEHDPPSLTCRVNKFLRIAARQGFVVSFEVKGKCT